MKTNPILEEVWRIKDQLAEEAGCDIRKMCEQTRKWALEHPHNGPIIRSAADLRRLVQREGRRRSRQSAMVLKDKPLDGGRK